jgi:hypothetical protein
MEGDRWNVADSPHEVADKLAQLGTPLAEFAVSGGRVVWLLTAAVLLFPLGLLLLGLAVAALFVGHAEHGLIHLLILGVSLLLASIFLAMRTWRRWGLRVLVFPEGLVRVQGSHAEAFFWDEVRTVLQRKNGGHWARFAQGKYVYTVHRHGGGEFHFDDALPDVRRLGDLIRRESLRHLLPAALETYETGQPLPFGRLQLSRHGLRYGTEWVPWEKVREVNVTEDRLTIHKHGNWLPFCVVAVGEVPNLHVFEALARRELSARFHAEGDPAS